MALLVTPTLAVLIGFSVAFWFVVVSAIWGAGESPGARDESYLQVLQDYGCVLADVRDGAAQLYQCELADGVAYLTPAQVSAMAEDAADSDEELDHESI